MKGYKEIKKWKEKRIKCSCGATAKFMNEHGKHRCCACIFDSWK